MTRARMRRENEVLFLILPLWEDRAPNETAGSRASQ